MHNIIYLQKNILHIFHHKKISWDTITYYILYFKFQEGLQFLESSRNEIIYKTKKVEYILEKEKRARRGSQDINKITRLKAWLITKVSIVDCAT